MKSERISLVQRLAEQERDALAIGQPLCQNRKGFTTPSYRKIIPGPHWPANGMFTGVRLAACWPRGTKADSS